MELAVTIDAMKPFVKAIIYILDGEGTLALAAYECLMKRF